MTTPSGTEDIPLATVPVIGVTEVAHGVVLLGAVLAVLFGRDFGLTQNAQLIAEIAVVVLPASLGHSRSRKHAAAMAANATVLAAKASAPSPVPAFPTDL